MTQITNPLAITAMQLRTQLSALKLEGMGMKRRGRSLTVVLKEHYGLKKSASREVVAARVQEHLSQVESALLDSHEGSDH